MKLRHDFRGTPNGCLPAVHAEIKGGGSLSSSGLDGESLLGTEILARFSLAGAVGRLPALFPSWDRLVRPVAVSHMKYQVLAHSRLPAPAVDGPSSRNDKSPGQPVGDRVGLS